MKNLLDFEELQRLAQDDPDKLEKLRIQWCEQLISEAPSDYRRKLRGLQFRIDMERRKSKSPMAACISLSGMMHDSFDNLRYALNEASGLSEHNTGYREDTTSAQAQEAKVLPFRRA
ncbi:hypothetical protein A9Q99_22175 [Gammaproteobacteria bacterium 45_16_T64]|nr:hypothetical protein A9Q99_22175 [Gammaproteobacteria bacterium 45_16_T64]